MVECPGRTGGFQALRCHPGSPWWKFTGLDRCGSEASGPKPSSPSVGDRNRTQSPALHSCLDFLGKHERSFLRRPITLLGVGSSDLLYRDPYRNDQYPDPSAPNPYPIPEDRHSPVDPLDPRIENIFGVVSWSLFIVVQDMSDQETQTEPGQYSMSSLHFHLALVAV